MKTVMQYLSLLLCFELIMAPMAGPLMSSSNAYADEAKSCPSGQEYNSSLNRCVTKNSVTQTNNNMDTCRNIENEEQKKACYAKNAKEITEASSGQGLSDCALKTDEKERKKCFNKEGNGATFGNIASSGAKVALPLLFMIKALSDGKKFSQCKPASLMLLYGGGAALLVGEVASFIQHAHNLNKMEDARKALNVKENADNSDDNKISATETQSQAFELLAKNEDSVAKVAKTKKITYGVATALFAAGAIMGTIETFQHKKALPISKMVPNPQGGFPTAADIMNAKNTVMRLTCGEQKYTADETIQQEKVAKTAESDKVAAEKEGKEVADGGKKGGGIGIDTILMIVTGAAPLAMSFLKKKTDETPTQTTPESNLPGTEEKSTSCGQGQAWSESKKQCIQVSSNELNIQEILDLKYKQYAAKNIKNARSYYEMMELMAESEHMDFESVSHPSYYEEDLIKDSFKDVPFYVEAAAIISDVVIGKSYAQAVDPNATSNAIKQGAKTEKLTLVKKAGQTVKKIMDKAVYTPQGRLVTNGLMGTWMGFMTAHMAKQQKASEDRAELLRKMKGEFDTQGGLTNCSSADRNDPGKPSCYCFTADNQVVPSRKENKICAMKIAALKSSTNNTASVKVCVNQNMTADPSCACKQTKSCMKISSSFKFSGINPGTFKMLSSGVGTADSLINGNVAAGDMDSATIGTNAARMKDAADQMAAQIPGTSSQQGELEKALVAASSGIGASGPGYSSGAAALPSSPAAASAELDKELKDTKDDQEITTAGSKNAGGQGFEQAAPEEPEFGMNSDMLANQETEIAEVMGQEMDMGQNADINNSSKTNIFEVLSNRYQRSGMRRLNGDGTKVDAPSESDIAQ